MNTFEVRIDGTGIVFACGPDETVLDAAQRAGLSLPYSCRKGVCSSCDAGLASGEVAVRGQGRAHAPIPAVRLCQARPLDNLTIRPQRLGRLDAAPLKTLPVRVHKIDHLARGVSVLRLRFPNGVRARFRAGQYLKVRLDDGDSRCFSLANAPHANDFAELHVRHRAGGKFTRALEALRPGDALTVELGHGACVLETEARRPVVLAVTGTGFAPAKAMIEDWAQRGSERPVYLYWGGRTLDDLYMAESIQALARRHPWLSFIPVLSRPHAGWAGRAGHIQHAVLADRPHLAGVDVVACGNPAMTTAARAAFIAAGLDPASFYCDPFVASGDVSP